MERAKSSQVSAAGSRPLVLIARTKQFAVRVVRLGRQMPREMAAEVLGRQLVRAGTSVGANYRAARRARSSPEFVAKLGIAHEEADECVYWLELLVESGIFSERRLSELLREANELTAIFVTSLRSARNRRK